MLSREFDGLFSVARAPADATGGGMSVSDAAAAYGAARTGQPAPPPEEEEESAPSQVSEQPPADDSPAQDSDEAVDDGDAAPEEASGEGQTEDEDAAEGPPVDPPRSFGKEDKALFNSLPREMQERIAERERLRDVDFSRRQGEAVNLSRALAAHAQAAEQARVNYEQEVQNVVQQGKQFLSGEYADIRNWDDADRMRVENPMRYLAWKSATERYQAYQVEQHRLQSERQIQSVQQFHNWVSNENAKFVNAAPEFADPEKGPKLFNEARTMLLQDYDFDDNELGEMWNNGRPVILSDNRVQRLIRDALRYKMARADAKKKPTPRPGSPSPQRSGVPPAKGEAANAALETLRRKLGQTHSVNDAVALMRAKRR